MPTVYFDHVGVCSIRINLKFRDAETVIYCLLFLNVLNNQKPTTKVKLLVCRNLWKCDHYCKLSLMEQYKCLSVNYIYYNS